MGFFNLGAVERAQRNLDNARRSMIDVQNACTLARVSLEDAGRDTHAVAVEMICASASQLERDIIRWKELIGRTRENHE